MKAAARTPGPITRRRGRMDGALTAPASAPAPVRMPLRQRTRVRCHVPAGCRLPSIQADAVQAPHPYYTDDGREYWVTRDCSHWKYDGGRYDLHPRSSSLRLLVDWLKEDPANWAGFNGCGGGQPGEAAKRASRYLFDHKCSTKRTPDAIVRKVGGRQPRARAGVASAPARPPAVPADPQLKTLFRQWRDTRDKYVTAPGAGDGMVADAGTPRARVVRSLAGAPQAPPLSVPADAPRRDKPRVSLL